MIIRGPFNLKWGENTLEDVESISIEYNTESEDYTTHDGRVFKLDKSKSIVATLSVLSTDIASLALLLPQYLVPDGGTLSSGEVVDNSDGSIDVLPIGCDDSIVYDDLDIISCGNPGQITRIKNARTRISGIQIDGRIQKYVIDFIGEPTANMALLQVIPEAYIPPEEFFILDDGDYFFLDMGGQLIL